MLLFCPQVLVSLENDRFEMWTCTLTPSHIKPASAICFLGWVGPCGLWGKQGHVLPVILNLCEPSPFWMDRRLWLFIPAAFGSLPCSHFSLLGMGGGSLSFLSPVLVVFIPFPWGLPKRPEALPVPLTPARRKNNLISTYLASVFHIPQLFPCNK